jgi:hypothetical protein
VIDAYCYDEEDEEDVREYDGASRRGRFSSSPTPLDSEPPELSQTPSRDLDSLSSFHSSDRLKDWDERPSSYMNDSSDNNVEELGPPRGNTRVDTPATGIYSDNDMLEKDLTSSEPNGQKIFERRDMAPLEIQHLPAQHISRDIQTATHKENHRQSTTLQRSSEELPRRVSVSIQTLAFGEPAVKARPTLVQYKAYVPGVRDVKQMTSIQRDISKLPQLPTNKSRLSRHDWAQIQAYSKRHSKRPSASRTLSSLLSLMLGPRYNLLH